MSSQGMSYTQTVTQDEDSATPNLPSDLATLLPPPSLPPSGLFPSTTSTGPSRGH